MNIQELCRVKEKSQKVRGCMVPFLQHSPNDNTVETEHRAEKEWSSEVRYGEVVIEGYHEGSLFFNGSFDCTSANILVMVLFDSFAMLPLGKNG